MAAEWGDTIRERHVGCRRKIRSEGNAEPRSYSSEGSLPLGAPPHPDDAQTGCVDVLMRKGDVYRCLIDVVMRLRNSRVEGGS